MSAPATTPCARRSSRSWSSTQQAPAALETGGAAQAIAELTTVSMSVPIAERPGTVIGPYKLLQVIGEGGFGTVFQAEQEKPVRRRVALKIIKLGMDTRQVIARFEAERQALALMDHPSIARVLDAGATATGRPYFVMELVRGEPITRFCDQRRLSIRERLELFEQVCQAVQHAHMKGVIHRDIKPTNVLVTVVDGDKPLAKIIDFGIAKATSAPLTDKTLITGFRQLIGTPEYMSPEQADISAMDIDTRSDVYTLGVLLYELLTGVTPIDSRRLRSAALAELQRMIKEEEPPRPSLRVTLGTREGPTPRRDASPHGAAAGEPKPAQDQHGAPAVQDVHDASATPTTQSIALARRTDPAALTRTLRNDLDWIVMKCLEKDRTRRYESAVALAQDVRRYLSGDAVVAAPASLAYRLRKVARRHRVALSAGLTVSVALLLGVVGLSLGLQSARTHGKRTSDALADRDVALQAERAAKESLVRQADYARETLVELSASLSPGDCPDAAAEGFSAGWEHSRAAEDHSDQFPDAPEAERALKVLGGFARVQASSLKSALANAEWNSYVANLGFASAALDAHDYPTAREQLRRCPDHLRGWEWQILDSQANSVRVAVRGLSDDSHARFVNGGARVFTIHNHAFFSSGARSWDLDSNLIANQLYLHMGTSTVFLQESGLQVHWPSWDPNSAWIGAQDGKTPIQVSPVAARIISGIGVHYPPQLSEDRTRLLLWTDEAAIVWDTLRCMPSASLSHEGSLQAASIAPSGTRAVTIAANGSVRLWDTVTGLGEVLAEVVHDTMGGRYDCQFSPDGRHFVTWRKGGEARLWTADGVSASPALYSTVNSAAFHVGGAWLATGSEDGTLQRWAVNGTPIGGPVIHGTRVDVVQFSGANELLSYSYSYPLNELTPSDQHRLSPSGRYQQLRMSTWEVPSMRKRWLGVERPRSVLDVGVLPHPGAMSVTCSDSRRLLDMRGKPVWEWSGYDYQASEFSGIQLSPDGKHVLVQDNDGRDQVLLVAAVERWGTPIRTMHLDRVRRSLELEALGCLDLDEGVSADRTDGVQCLSPNGSRQIVVLPDWKLLFRDTATGRDLVRVRVPSARRVLGSPARIDALSFSADGKRLVLTLRNDYKQLAIQVWDVRLPSERRDEAVRRWELRSRAVQWVDEIRTANTFAALRQEIRQREDLEPFERLAALDIVDDRSMEAEVALDRMKLHHLSPDRVRAAAASEGEHSPLVRRLLELAAEAWAPHHGELNDLAWPVVEHPGANPYRLAAALECALLAVEQSPGNANVINTLGVAQYRSAQYSAALTTLTRSLQFAGKATSADMAFIAMSYARLGDLDNANRTFEQLVSLGDGLTGAERAQHDAWLAEAEATIRECSGHP